MKKALVAMIGVSLLSAPGLLAQTLHWSAPAKYGTGDQTSVSMNSSGLVIEVHKSQNYNKLYYHVGKLNRSNGLVTWGTSEYLATKTEVRFPSVAITQNSNVIIMFDDDNLHLRYLTGTLNPTGSVDQTLNVVVPDTQYDTGRTPQISVNSSGTLVEVHQNNGSAGKLFYRVGFVDPTTNRPDIGWISGQQGISYDIGSSPHISLNDRSQFVEVHEGSSSTKLYYRRGHTMGDQMLFRSSEYLDSKIGLYPSVALTNFDLTVSLYGSSSNIYALPGMLSTLDPAWINWRNSLKLQDYGRFPSVTTDGDWMIAVWAKSFGNNDLQYSTARVP